MKRIILTHRPTTTTPPPNAPPFDIRTAMPMLSTMNALRRQYVLAFAVMGSLLPNLSAYLEQSEHLSRTQIGWIIASSGLAFIISPIIVAYLADAHIDARKLLGAIFTIAAAALAALAMVSGFVPILLVYIVFALMWTPVLSLQDAVNFGYQKQREQAGLPTTAYHHIRVWGTIGFIIPTALLTPLMSETFGFGLPLRACLWAAAAFCTLGLLNTFTMPDPKLRADAAAKGQSFWKRLPTVNAARVMLEPHMLMFTLAMFIVALSLAAYYTFYPVYLQALGVSREWLGPIVAIGVVLEVGYMVGYGWFEKHLGIKWLLVVGVAAACVRAMLLATTPVIAAAIAVQLIHGLIVVTVHVVPPVFLNSRAQHGFRGSIQGLYTLLVMGVARMFGNIIAGQIAGESLQDLQWLYVYAAVLCAVAMALLTFAFVDRTHAGEKHATA